MLHALLIPQGPPKARMGIMWKESSTPAVLFGRLRPQNRARSQIHIDNEQLSLMERDGTTRAFLLRESFKGDPLHGLRYCRSFVSVGASHPGASGCRIG